MVNWTDSIIHWNQLPATELKRLIATWGKDAKAIAAYDRKHGFANTAPRVTPQVPALKGMTPLGIKPTKKVVQKVTRQKHTGADGEVKYVEHRNLYVGFMGGKVVVTKRTAEQCKEFLRTEFKLEV